jgi:hypothetical protein
MQGSTTTMIASMSHPVTQAAMDAMTDEQYAALDEECYEARHPVGACPLCRDEAETDEALEVSWESDADERRDYIGSIWDRGGFDFAPKKGGGLQGRSDALVAAHKTVKSFVDTFATGDAGGRFAVTFDPHITTAGTDYAGRKVVISPAPVLDKTIDARTAGLILTAMAVHEASHVRYGKTNAAAITRTFGKKDPRTHILSNILEDVRIERRFVEDYPGYTDVFAPALEYVAKAAMTRIGVETLGPSTDPTTFAGQSIRYPAFIDWTPESIAERDWWQAWAKRYAVDKVSLKIEGIREALAHIDAAPPVDHEESPEPTPGTGSGSDGQSADEPGDTGHQGGAQSSDADGPESDQTGDDQDAEDDVTLEARLNVVREDSKDLRVPTEHDDEEAVVAAAQAVADAIDEIFGECPTVAVAAAAISNGVDADRIDGRLAQDIVNAAATLVKIDYERGLYSVPMSIDVRPAASLKGRERREVVPSPAASSAIGNALIRSRTGHTGIERGMTRGRCDSKSLYRIADNDYRLFHRRVAPSPGRYLIHMLVDWSGSMAGQPQTDVMDVVASIANASRHVPSMRMMVGGWTSPQNNRAAYLSDRSVVAGLYEAWRSGQPITAIGDLGRITEGGTPDAWVLRHAIDAIRRDAQPGEQPVIMMLSDGQGYTAEVKKAVEYAAEKGVRVVSVAIGHAIDEDTQKEVYGHGNYVPWAGDIIATAAPLARLIGRMVAS